MKTNKSQKIVLSDSITIIKAHEYEEINLTELTTNNVEEIRPYAFWNNQLETVGLSDNLKIVDELAFMDNIIFSLTIGNSTFRKMEDFNTELTTIENKSSKTFDFL